MSDGAGAGGEGGGGGDVVQVLVTTPTREAARTIGEVLLTRRLAACVQVGGPLESRFWWEGSLDEATEWLLVAKTTAALVAAVSHAVQEEHGYEVAEVVAVPVVAGSEAYLRWVRAEVRGDPGDGA